MRNAYTGCWCLSRLSIVKIARSNSGLASVRQRNDTGELNPFPTTPEAAWPGERPDRQTAIVVVALTRPNNLKVSVRNHAEHLAIEAVNEGEPRVAKANRALGNARPLSVDTASASRIGPLASIGPVYWNGTHPSVFEFRVEKERDHDFDAAGASV